MNCIIVHGCPSKKPEIPTYDKHWLPWIKKELEKREIKTLIPLMPTPWEPRYEEWKDIFDKTSMNEDSILIGHSCGGAFLVRWIEETKKKIRKLILVSPGKSGNESSKTLSDLYGGRIYKNLKNYVKEQIVIFTADDDIKYHISNAEEYRKEISAKIINLGKGFGHFTLGDMGTDEFPELLEEILK